MTRRSGISGGTLEEGRRHFERWRKTRAHGSRIPEALWALAVKAAREHGVKLTAQYLHLGFNDLKRRLEASSAAAARKPRDSAFPSQGSGRRRQRAATFVELAPPPTALSPCTIELENAQGSKMKIEFKGVATSELVALSRALWDGRV
ncbi:MAG: hypothetical protein ACRD3O_04755 [Terriglobia bacterium]